MVGSGCGSKKKKSTTTTTPATTTSASGGLTSSDCANLLAAESTISGATSGTIPKDIAAQVARMKQLEKGVPANVKADLETLSSAAGSLSKLHLKSGQTTLTQAQLTKLMQLMSPILTKLTAASADLTKWASKACAGK
ncbi:MAG: hypothetical protein ABSC51_11005 [Gaiellaceae bacterium]